LNVTTLPAMVPVHEAVEKATSRLMTGPARTDTRESAVILMVEKYIVMLMSEVAVPRLK